MTQKIKVILATLFVSLILYSDVSAKSDISSKTEYNLAICSVFKNNAPYLKEWIEFHRLVGVEHFFLYDNSSTDAPRKVLNSYIKQGIVTLIDWPDKDREKWNSQIMAWVYYTQVPAFEDGLRRAVGRVKWMAFLDSDEFIVPVNTPDIPTFLQQHKNAPGVTIQWQVYGTSGVYNIPPNSLMVELLTLKCDPSHPVNDHVKTIVRPEFCQQFNGPHECTYKYNAQGYDAPIEEIRINHYINRTVSFFYIQKLKGKQKIDNVTWDEAYKQQFLNLGNEVEDRIMDRFIPNLRKRMGFTP